MSGRSSSRLGGSTKADHEAGQQGAIEQLGPLERHAVRHGHRQQDREQYPAETSALTNHVVPNNSANCTTFLVSSSRNADAHEEQVGVAQHRPQRPGGDPDGQHRRHEDEAERHDVEARAGCGCAGTGRGDRRWPGTDLPVACQNADAVDGAAVETALVLAGRERVERLADRWLDRLHGAAPNTCCSVLPTGPPARAAGSSCTS